MPHINEEKTENLITTYMERGLHRSLKTYFCPDESKHEIKIGRFVADACDGKTIFEIQTGSLSPLRKKLEYYLNNTDLDVVVVRPIAKDRRIFWLKSESGELERAPRLSSKHENLASGIAELHYLFDLFGRDRLSFCFVLMEIDEVRLLDGYGKQKKIRATSVDRIAGEIYSLHYINDPRDVENAILPLLPDAPFDRETLAAALKLKALKLWSAQKLLLEMNILKCEKQGNKLIFEKSNTKINKN